MFQSHLILKELKAAYAQYSPTAPFNQMMLKNRALEKSCPSPPHPPSQRHLGGLKTVGQRLPVRSRLSAMENSV